MIVAIAAGQQPRLTANPLVPIETITAYIVQVAKVMFLMAPWNTEQFLQQVLHYLFLHSY